MGASNAGGVDKNRDSQPISGFGIDDWWSVINSFDRGVKFITAYLTTIAMHQWTLFMTARLDVVFSTRRVGRREQNLSLGIGKSKDEVTLNVFTAEANKRQTRSIARPLCDRASCFFHTCAWRNHCDSLPDAWHGIEQHAVNACVVHDSKRACVCVCWWRTEQTFWIDAVNTW